MKRFILFMSVLVALAGIVFCGTVGAATYSDYVTGNITLTQPAIEPVTEYVPFIQYRKFDFSNAAIHGGSGVTNGDVVKLFNIPRDSFIEEIGFMNLRALHSGTSATIGDAVDADGYIANSYYSSMEFLDLSKIQTGVTRWKNIGPTFSGTSYWYTQGVSVYQAGTNTLTTQTNHGAYFIRGVSPYAGPGGTINMTFYVNTNLALVTVGVTPYFEAYIKGFKRVTR